MTRLALLRLPIGLCVVLLLVSACGQSDTDGTSPAEASVPSGVAAIPTTSSEPTTISTNGPVIEDPVEFVLAFNNQVQNENWDAVRSMLVEDFRQFDDEVIGRGLGLRIPSGVGADPVAWSVETNAHFTTVRLKEWMVIALVLREADNGGWLVDPGLQQLAMATLRSEGVTGWGGESRIGFERSGFAEEDFMAFSMHLREEIEYVGIDDDDVQVSLRWMFTRGATGQVPLDNVSWSAAGETGPVEVSWATAKIDDGSMTFPQPEIEGSPSYAATFTLRDVPEADGFELHIEDMQLVAPDLDDAIFSTTIRIPMEPYPQAGRVEIPGVEATLGEQEIEPADPPRLTLAGADVTTAEDGVTVEYVFEMETDPAERVELTTEPEVTWSDGEVTSAAQRGGTGLFVTTEREGVPEGVVPVELVFPYLARSLPVDPAASVTLDRIKTRWGTFTLGELVEQPDGSWSVAYTPAGKRWIGKVELDADGVAVHASGVSTGFDADFNIIDARLDLGPEFDAARDQLPLPAEVTVREIAEHVTVDLDMN